MQPFSIMVSAVRGHSAGKFSQEGDFVLFGDFRPGAAKKEGLGDHAEALKNFPLAR
jgi:hypothetical protein